MTGSATVFCYQPVSTLVRSNGVFCVALVSKICHGHSPAKPRLRFEPPQTKINHGLFDSQALMSSPFFEIQIDLEQVLCKPSVLVPVRS
jgi:hypothetical protein